MGISDREYYRDKTRGVGWLSGEAPACKAIIVANVAMFVGQKLFDGLTPALQANSHEIFHQFRVWELVTATFLHGDPFHILFNMMFLWMVGREMESFYGTRDFAAMYLTAAAFSTFCWAVLDALGPHAGMIPMIGASGAVMAVMVLYTLYYPRREVIFIIFPVEMRLLLIVFLGYNVLQLLSKSNEPVAFASHLGGAAYGYFFKVGNLRLSRLDKIFDRKPRLRIVSAETREPSPTRATAGPTWSSSTPAAAKPAPTVLIPEEKFDEKLDEILVKIAQQGRGSLSDDENRVLEEASRRARNRRSERI